MKAPPIIPISISLLTAILSYTMIVHYLSKEKKTSILKKYVWVLSICFIWSSGDVLVILSDQNYFDLNKYIIILNKYKFLAAYLWGPLWFIFCYSYLNNKAENFFANKSKFTKTFYTILFFLPQTIQYVIYLTNYYLHNWVLYWPPEGCQFRPAFYVSIVTTIIYLAAGAFFLIKNTKKNCSSSKQLLFVMLSLFVPTLIATFYWSYDLYSYFVYFDITPSMFLLTLLLLNIATYKYSFLSIVPLAFPKVIDNLNDVIIVIDKSNRIANVSKPYNIDYPYISQLNDGDDIKHFTNMLKHKSEFNTQSDTIVCAIESGTSLNEKGEFYMPEEDIYLNIDINPLFDKGKNVGRVVAVRNITDYRKLLNSLKEKNKELAIMNGQLKDYAVTVEELAISKERNRFARDVHDSIGHTMSVLISIIGACIVSCKNEQNIKSKLEEALSIGKKGLTELRKSLYQQKSKNFEAFNLINALKKLIKEFEFAGIKVDLTIEGNYIQKGLKFSDEIYMVCKEALTNSLKHGKSKLVNIFIEFSPTMTKIFIFDDGIGCSEIKKGIGLSSMEERVFKANGHIFYGSDGEKGFSIHIDIPV